MEWRARFGLQLRCKQVQTEKALRDATIKPPRTESEFRVNREECVNAFPELFKLLELCAVRPGAFICVQNRCGRRLFEETRWRDSLWRPRRCCSATSTCIPCRTADTSRFCRRCRGRTPLCCETAGRKTASGGVFCFFTLQVVLSRAPSAESNLHVLVS